MSTERTVASKTVKVTLYDIRSSGCLTSRIADVSIRTRLLLDRVDVVGIGPLQ